MPPWLTELVKLLGDNAVFITPAIAYGGVTFCFFHWLDKKASPAAKKAFSDWLQPVPHDPRDIVRAGRELFDRLYTTQLFSASAFIRSALFTTCMFFIFLYEFHSSEFVLLFPDPYLAFGLGVGLVTNILSDYFSLFIVRQWLRAGINKIHTLLIGPAAGVVAVISLALARDLLITLWAYAVAPPSMPRFVVLLETVLRSNFEQAEWVGISLSALLVHLWLPMLVLCLGLLKVMNYFRAVVGWTQWFLKGGKQHPLDAIGYVAAVIVFATTVTLQRIFS